MPTSYSADEALREFKTSIQLTCNDKLLNRIPKFVVLIRRVKLKDGYDVNGTYFGEGENLYSAALDVEKSSVDISRINLVWFRADNYQNARKSLMRLNDMGYCVIVRNFE